MPPITLLSADAAGFTARGPGRAVYVPTAAGGLPDAEAIAAPFLARLAELGWAVTPLDLAVATRDQAGARLAAADLLFVGGGDPFRLLRTAAALDFGELVRAAVARGMAYAGVSAGATAAAKDLTPVPLFSPFRPEPGQSLVGWGLAPVLILPHDDRPGRRARHQQALREHGSGRAMLAVEDAEWVTCEADRWRLHRPAAGAVFRAAEPRDAEAIAETYVAAGRAEWSAFLGEQTLAKLEPPTAAWAARITAAAPGELLAAEDVAGVCGFVWARPASGSGLADDTGEIAAFYTHPRAWGRGAGRRLLQLGLDRLRAIGARTAILWTEARNARPRRFYERAGWRLDGATRERDFLGQPLRELRHALPLFAEA